MKKTIIFIILIVVIILGLIFIIYKPSEEEKCIESGGKWGKFGLDLEEQCNMPTSDSGEICTDSDECEGNCIGENKDSTSGECSEWTIVKGCRFFVENGVTGPKLCVD